MTSKLYHLASRGILAAAFTAVPAMAQMTPAGDSITNTATVNYSVGGVPQPGVSGSDSFVVDRVVNLTVAEFDEQATIVVPGQPGAVTRFTLTNTSNATLDFALDALQVTTGAGAHGGTDSFDITGMTIYLDANNNGVVDSGEAVITHVDDLASLQTVSLLVVGDIPGGLGTGAVARVNLTATARERGGVGTLGGTITATTGANTAGMDTVFADAAGVGGDTARNGSHSDADDYYVSTATLTVTKSSLVLEDPVNGTTNPKLIPGATVRYCIAVANAAGGAAANGVSISDTLPTQVTFVSGSIRLNGTLTGSTCNTDGTAGGNFNGTVVSGSLNPITAGGALTLIFDATVN